MRATWPFVCEALESRTSSGGECLCELRAASSSTAVSEVWVGRAKMIRGSPCMLPIGRADMRDVLKSIIYPANCLALASCQKPLAQTSFGRHLDGARDCTLELGFVVSSERDKGSLFCVAVVRSLVCMQDVRTGAK